MNYQETKEYLKRYLKARIPVIVLNTVEKNRALRLFKDITNETNYNFSLYQMSQGISDLKTNTLKSEDKTIMSALDYISNEIKHQENLNFILTDLADINESTMVSRYLVDAIDKAETMSGTIVIITSEPVWQNINRLGISLKLGYPTEKELEETIVKTIAPYKNQIEVEWDEVDYKNASTYLQGLSEMEAKNIISSIIVKGSVKKEDLKELKYAKQMLFNEIAGLEAIAVEEDFQIAGLDNLVEWLNEKKTLMDPTKKEELQERGIAAPRGVLLTGVPGCGKSLLADCICGATNGRVVKMTGMTRNSKQVSKCRKQKSILLGGVMLTMAR